MKKTSHEAHILKQTDVAHFGPDADSPDAAERPQARLARGLSAKLLFLTILFVMLAEVLIYVPSVANFRNNWLMDKLGSGKTAALALEAAPDGMLPRELEIQLLENIGAMALVIRQKGARRLVALSDMPPPVDLTMDFRGMVPPAALRQTFTILISSKPSILRVVDGLGTLEGDFIELVMEDTALRQAMLNFSINILSLSLVISGISAALVYFSLHLLLIRPLRKLTENMIAFRTSPENRERVIVPGKRRDEIGIAECELSAMQEELQSALNQKTRLAALGLAVSKVSHDMRNILASAQLISDRMATLPDPTVQRFAPKLIATLDRAIDFCTSTLKYGSASEAPPMRRLVSLQTIVNDVYVSLGLELHDHIGWDSDIDPELRVDVDPDQFHRVLLNLARNSVQVLEAEGAGDKARDRVRFAASRAGKQVVIDVSDTGPGIPDRAKSHLFEAFRGSFRPGGTGLGLAIASEIIAAHNGRIELADIGQGSCFRLTIPDRETGNGR